MSKSKSSLLKHNGINYLLPFVLITACFSLWGFANDITNPMVKAFSKIFRMSVTEGALVQLAFYGGYFAMAFPAAIFIRKFSYKKGIMLGLLLYAVGAFLFFPAKESGNFYPFLAAYFILTCGLSFLETSANPYILTMGPEETSTRRLNLAQSFNPMGSLVGMYVAMNFIQARLNPMSTAERAVLSDTEFTTLRQSDLSILIAPYLAIGIVVMVMFLIIWIARMPTNGDKNKQINFFPTLKRIFSIPNYRQGVIAQFFYVGAQIMCWTFIIQYGTRVLMAQGMEEQAAEVLSQKYNIVAMIIFCVSRFVCTYLLKFLNPGKLLRILAIAAAIFTLGAIFLQNIWGLYFLVAVSACMSLMFPTIYGIALKGMGDDAKFGAAGLIMAILGGSVLPPLQASIIDLETIGNSFPAVNASFVLPLICFVVVAWYGTQTYKRSLAEY
ncbi:L-fucose:H+ symporter permease [Proteiniphilum sp. UBA1028]|jgi:FHS family L-fucose permease-like MFS transporter|uniref:L-fucose:H+ symporter permease n=1 Tax=Proteiniphilum sp. UBA1028 TaxID=1947251 RepID=UPI000E98351F|nr:L-fucose:H+ symporter permease [Proteiniphilum sp. UBA1028]HBG58800.1 L-fucose:H+ symporter permease [Porphyromonadaceae bacterium]